MSKTDMIFLNNKFSKRLDMLLAIKTMAEIYDTLYFDGILDFEIELEKQLDTELGDKEYYLLFRDYCIDLFSNEIPKG